MMFDLFYLYDYVYCGLLFYGDVSLQRMCEWLVYYVYFFGERLYFMFYDVGGFYF